MMSVEHGDVPSGKGGRKGRVAATEAETTSLRTEQLVDLFGPQLNVVADPIAGSEGGEADRGSYLVDGVRANS